METVLISVVQFAVSILLAALAAYLGLWLYERATPEVDEWKAVREGNQAVGITLAAVVVGLAIVLRPAVAGSIPPAGGRFGPDLAQSALPLYVLLLMLVRALLGLALGVAGILFAMWLFLRLTRDLDEMDELKKGNTAVAAMLAGVILAVCVLVSPVVTNIADQLMPVFLP